MVKLVKQILGDPKKYQGLSIDPNTPWGAPPQLPAGGTGTAEASPVQQAGKGIQDWMGQVKPMQQPGEDFPDSPEVAPDSITGVEARSPEDDAAYWDSIVADEEKGLKTPPFVSSPGYEEARRRRRYGNARGAYETAVATPAEKQPLWKQALFMGLQAVRQIATEKPEEYQLLGNAQKNYKVQQAAGRYLPLEHQRQQDQKYKMGEANLDIARQKPAIAQQAVDAKTQNAVTAQRRAEIAERTQTWKESDKAKYWEWEGIKQEAKQKNDDRTYEMAVRKQAEIERHNQVGEQQAATNEQGRNDRQSSGQTFTAGQNALKRQMQSAIKQYDTAVKNHDQAKAEAARERLIKLKAELGQ
jgi:hypothetical protein